MSRPSDTQTRANERLWRADNVARYANRDLRPVEVVLLARYSAVLGGRVLELGCGAGRILGYLGALGGEVHGIDISPAMVEHCRWRYPAVNVHVGTLTDISAVVSAPFDAVLVPDNTLDVIDPEQRRRALAEIHSLLAPDGLLIFSSHSLAYADALAAAPRPGPARAVAHLLGRLARSSPAAIVRAAGSSARGARNRRRLAPLQRRSTDYAIVNDPEGDYAALHYNVRRDAQERQLAEVGFALVECLDADGETLAPGDDGDSPWLHYVARLA